MVLENKFPSDERVEKEALSLISAGHEVHLACATLKNEPEHEVYKGIFLHRVNSTDFYYNKARIACLTTPFYFKFWTRFIKRILLNSSFDVIHIHDLPLAKVGIKMANKLGIKVVVDFHENFPFMLKEEEYTKTLLGRILSPIQLWINYEKYVLKNINNTVFVCEEMRNRMTNIAVVENSVVLDNTIDTKRWPVYQESEESDEFLKTIYVGGFTVKRGIEIAIKGIAIFNKESKRKAVLDLYGNGRKEYINQLLKLAEDEGVAKFVNFKGYLKLPEDAQTLGSYDVGLIPHLKNTHTDNTSPNKIFQYYNYKLPVLCSNCNYLVRLVNETKGGLTYDNQSPADFAEKLKLFTNKAGKKKYGDSGFESVVNKYNWDKSAEALIKLYRNVESIIPDAKSV